jgi:hypothetical protein
MRRFLLAQLDFPRARLALSIALPRGVNGRSGPRLGARERVSARVDPEQQRPEGSCRTLAIAPPRNAAMPTDGTADGTPGNDEGPGCSAGASDLLFLLAPPTGFEPVSPR